MMKCNVYLIFLLLVIILSSCKEQNNSKTLSGLYPKDFQMTVDGQQTELYKLVNDNGMEVCITNYGARVVSIMAPDRKGKMEDIVGGFPNIKDYVDIKQNFGALIGRYIGRIRDAHFELAGVEYKLIPNKDTHTAHGGDPGFANRVWRSEQLESNKVSMSYMSPAGENGFPGNLLVTVFYTLTPANELDIKYEALTDAPTVLNLSNHSFFNISGDLNTSVEDQLLYVNSTSYTPYDSTKCVTGDIVSIENTPFDFLKPTRLGERIDADNEQLKITGGYDHTWVLDSKGNDAVLAAKVSDPESGRTLEVYTTEPGLQIYTANGLRGAMVGKNGIAYPKRSSICLETMHFQDSPNQPQFPTTALYPGDKFHSHTIYKFGIE